jgi:arsenate reductase
MAEGYLRHFSDGNAEIFSAGIEAHGLNQRAVAVMHEDGIDITGHTSKTIEDLPDITFDYVITVCDHAAEVCPVFPAATKQIHHSFPDPAKAVGTEVEIMEKFRKVRDEIRRFAKEFIKEIR